MEQAQLIVSDGGLGFPDRESIRIETSTPTADGVMRVSWIQSNQTPSGTDLRGDPGSLRGDAIPEPSTLANLATSRPFDRFLLLRIDAPTGPLPLLYITSSDVSVVAHPATAR